MKKGFSLIEMMVVVGIIGIVIVIAIPNFAAMQRRARINAAAQAIAQDIRQFRERSLSGSINYRVKAIDSRSYEVEKVIRPDSTLILTRRLAETTGGNIRFGVVGNVVSVPP
jgi:prepilin-type N-terminal cleavage/methylation domain-containing protein